MEQVTVSTHSGEPNPLDTNGLCLLSLDGGGVRGLSTLYILKSIMDRLNYERKEGGLDPVKPCEVFDLIGGTSTGGLIAIMLGRLEMGVDECIDAYTKLAETVFGRKQSSFPISLKGKLKPRFDSATLEKAVRKVVTASDISETELFNDGKERGCKTFVCTADRNTKAIIRLRSYNLPDEPNIRATICQAALATSAATTFFEPVSIEDRTFADGGLGSNNPVDEVEGEASNIWCSETGDLKPLVKCFISIGTGNPGHKAFETNLLKFLGKTIVEIATETENTEKRFIARWAKHFDQRRYYRFNVEQGLQNIGLDEYKKTGVMKSASDGYLTHTAQKFRVKDCIHNLRLKQNHTAALSAAIVNEYPIRSKQHQTLQSMTPITHSTHFIVPFSRNPNFTGRESQLAQLENLFAEGRTKKFAVTGLGGMGKTQLVLEFVYIIRSKHKDCLIIWIPAVNMESLHQAYLDVARKLGLAGCEDGKTDVKRLVQQHLSDRTEQWLLVYDNADDMDMWIGEAGPEPGARRLIYYLPRSDHGYTIFTSRDRKTAVKLVQQNMMEMTEMDDPIATQLLQKCLTNADLDDSRLDTKSLLKELTYLPLAIVQAAAYINENSTTIADYLSLMTTQEEDTIELLSEEFEDDWRYGNIKNPVATTWLISFEKIRQCNPLAAQYLSFMACINPKAVPKSLLPQGPTRKKVVEAIGTLTAYSFISKQHADLVYDLHRLVHLSTRNWLRKETLLASSTEEVITRLEEVFPDGDHKNRSVWRTYFPHVHYALDSDIVDKEFQSRMSLTYKYGICLKEDGRWHEAEIAFSELLEVGKRKLGQDHPTTLIYINWLASVYKGQGRWDAAENLIVQVLEMRKKKLGIDHPDTLMSMANLASTYSTRGRWDAAEELEVQVLEMRKTKLGTDHPDTLMSMANLASTYSTRGRWDAAEELEVQVLDMRKTKLGIDHPDTLMSMANLASTYSTRN